MPELQRIVQWLETRWPLLLGALYIVGFIVWNGYLNRFGLSEFNFLQARFISAGILAVVIFCLPYYLLLRLKSNKYLVAALSLLYLFYFFPAIILPFVPTSFGGGRPIVTSLIGTPEQIKYLEDNFNIPSEKNGENARVQTMPLCLFFEREDRVVIGPLYSSVGRVVTLPDNRFIGFSQPLEGFKGVRFCLLNYNYNYVSRLLR